MTYEQAAKALINKPDQIYDAWNFPFQYDESILFRSVYKDCGCLTEVKLYHGNGLTKYPLPKNFPLTELLNDDRIPESGKEITIGHLKAFVEWNKKLDKLYGKNRNN